MLCVFCTETTDWCSQSLSQTNTYNSQHYYDWIIVPPGEQHESTQLVAWISPRWTWTSCCSWGRSTWRTWWGRSTWRRWPGGRSPGRRRPWRRTARSPADRGRRGQPSLTPSCSCWSQPSSSTNISVWRREEPWPGSWGSLTPRSRPGSRTDGERRNWKIIIFLT